MTAGFLITVGAVGTLCRRGIWTLAGRSIGWQHTVHKRDGEWGRAVRRQEQDRCVQLEGDVG